MNTVGYGDFAPQNQYERIYVIIFVFVACAWFAMRLSQFSNLMQEVYKKNNRLNQEISLMNDFMRKKNVSKALRAKIQEYLENKSKEQKDICQQDEYDIINKLSFALKNQLMFESNSAVLNKVQVLKDQFSQDVLKELVNYLIEIQFSPGELIFNVGDRENLGIYIIRKGQIQIYIDQKRRNNKKIVLKTLKNGDFFGQKSFFSDQPRCESARSLEYTSAYLIQREIFLEILKKFLKDYQKFCQIRDKINLYNDYSGLQLNCFSCQHPNHTVDVCPLIHCAYNTQNIISKFNYSINQERRYQKRNIKKR